MSHSRDGRVSRHHCRQTLYVSPGCGIPPLPLPPLKSPRGNQPNFERSALGVERQFPQQLLELWGIYGATFWVALTTQAMQKPTLGVTLRATPGIGGKQDFQPVFPEPFFENWAGPRVQEWHHLSFQRCFPDFCPLSWSNLSWKIEVKWVKNGCVKLLSGPSSNHRLETTVYRPSEEWHHLSF